MRPRSVAAALLLTTAAARCCSDDDPRVGRADADPLAGVSITDAPPDALHGLDVGPRSPCRRRTPRRRAALPRRSRQRRPDDQASASSSAPYFANLRQLPLGRLRLRGRPGRPGPRRRGLLGRRGPGAPARRVRRRPGRHPGPVPLHPGRPAGPVPARVGRRTCSGRSRTTVQPQPWDDGEIVVARGRRGARDLRRGQRPGRRQAARPRWSAASPTWPAWSRRRGRSPSSSTPSPTPRSWRPCPGCPGEDPSALDGVAFPVFAAPDGEGGAELVATRFVLHPRMLDEAGPGPGPAGPARAHPRRGRRGRRPGTGVAERGARGVRLRPAAAAGAADDLARPPSTRRAPA